ncbi:hypothetical protein PLESTB_001388000 [Pleodorina starrii]|uniref:Uncharacterized protein n=1 Tax=Pleodorina starrii TaxID=330485 RepID=A0A9W6BVN2_9CHLO|nr:hypothetical protein PLESTB_001388000 [Pleodorina starrii]
MEWVVYSLVFGPNAAKPGAELKTGDAVQLVVDLDQSGFVPGAATPGAAFAGAPGSLYVWSWSGLPPTGPTDPSSGSAVYYSGGLTPLRLSAVVWVVTGVCGREVEGGLTAQDVSEALFGPPAGAALRSPGPPAKHYPAMPLSRLLHDCSYGNITLKRSSTLVLNLSLPCGGMRPNGAVWNATRGSAPTTGITGACGHNELWGWMEYALQNARQVLGVDTSAFRRRILVLPPAPTSTSTGGSGSGDGSGAWLCPAWQQRGSFGCDEALGCDMWIQGGLRSSRPQQLLQRLMTQLGSSLVLQPAAVSTRPTGASPLLTTRAPSDPTCPMGSEAQEAEDGEGQGSFKCFNGPNAHKLRLAQTALRLDAGSNLWEGSTRVVRLPPAALSPTNLLLVLPNWLPTSAATVRPLYGQYRAPVGGDAGLFTSPSSSSSSAPGRLVLHSVDSSVPPLGSEAGPAVGSVLLAALSPGESYRFEPGKVLVRFQSVAPPAAEDAGGVTGGSATVSVCRYSVVSEAGYDCYDGIDNDCNGLVDFADPACAAAGGFGRR